MGKAAGAVAGKGMDMVTGVAGKGLDMGKEGLNVVGKGVNVVATQVGTVAEKVLPQDLLNAAKVTREVAMERINEAGKAVEDLLKDPTWRQARQSDSVACVQHVTDAIDACAGTRSLPAPKVPALPSSFFVLAST